jgi:hypothetical protein
MSDEIHKRAPEPEPAPLSEAGRDLRAPRAAGVAGLLFAVLFVTALLAMRTAIGQHVSATAVQQAVVRGDVGAVMAGIYLIPFSGIAFLWFIAVVRDNIGAREDRFFATVFLGSGLIFVAMLFAATVSFAGPVVGKKFGVAGVPSIDAIDLARSLGYAFLVVFATKMAGVFTIVTSMIVLRLRVWPRWIPIVGLICALVLVFSVTYYEMIIILFPAWVALASLYILIAGGRDGAREAPDSK